MLLICSLQVARLSPKRVADILWSHAVIGDGIDAELYTMLEKQFALNMRGCKPKGFAMYLWAAAELKVSVKCQKGAWVIVVTFSRHIVSERHCSRCDHIFSLPKVFHEHFSNVQRIFRCGASTCGFAG